MDLKSDTIRIKSAYIEVDSIDYLKDYEYNDLDTLFYLDSIIYKNVKPSDFDSSIMFWDDSLGVMTSIGEPYYDITRKKYKYSYRDTVYNSDIGMIITRYYLECLIVDSFFSETVYWFKTQYLNEDISDLPVYDVLYLKGFFYIANLEINYANKQYEYSSQLINFNGTPVDLSELLKQVNNSVIIKRH